MNKQSEKLLGHEALTKREQKKAEKEFTESIMSIFRPKIVMQGYTDMQIPDNINKDILIERLMLAKSGERLAGETEAMWYISTASLIVPFSKDWADIFMYLCRKWMLKNKKELPDFLQEQIILNNLQERDLHDLRSWIYKKGMGKVK